MTISARTQRWLWLAAVAAAAAARFAGRFDDPTDFAPLGRSVAATLLGLGAALLPRPERPLYRGLRAAVVVMATASLLPFGWAWRLVFAVAVLWPTIALLRSGLSYPRDGSAAEPRHAAGARFLLASLIAAVALGAVYYRYLTTRHLEQTSALFVGIPAMLAIAVVWTSRPKSLIGMICKTIAVALLVSGIFLGEGFICILMASPIFFGVGIAIGAIIQSGRRPPGGSEVRLNALLLLAFVPLSLEGVRPELSFPREETVAAERVVAAAPEAVGRALAATPHIGSSRPPFLRLGFPRPVAAYGSGLAPGDRRRVRFAGGEGRPGDLVFEVVESRPGRVRFRAVSDASKIAHWLAWREAIVEWGPVASDGAPRTRVRWTLRFRRDLDPAWYFAPWERYAARLAAGVLIQDVATPPAGGAER
jgi:uncharacterized membrane protein